MTVALPARSKSAPSTTFPQAIFWFEATFVSDQKEQDLLTVAIDVHHGRQVRHLEELLDRAHLADRPWTPLADAPHPGLISAYPIARDRVVRTLSALELPPTPTALPAAFAFAMISSMVR